MAKDMILMKGKDLRRCWIIRKAIEKRITQKKAAEVLGLCERQIRRLIRRFRGEEEKGLIHRLRGKSSNRKFGEAFRRKVIRLYEKDYEGFGPTLTQEKLLERNKIRLNRETLRQWLIQEKLWTKRRDRRAHREWRERKASFGEMIQMDGSHHDWLEGRGPKLVLMAFVDDATGNVYARFYDYEGTWPAMESFYFYARRYGLPQSVYLDRHSTYKFHLKPSLKDELLGREPKSQFQAALARLGVDMIHAYSPQAKGRVERQFATFQDRLIKEMRLLNIKTKDGANEFLEDYLPKYNRQFSKPPANPLDLHRRSPELKLLSALSVHKPHILRNDNTVRHEGKFYQIKDNVLGRKPIRVTVRERLDGKLFIFHGNRNLCYQEIHERPRKTFEPKPKAKLKPPLPATNHPWRGSIRGKYPKDSRTPTEARYLSQANYRDHIQAYVEREIAVIEKEEPELLRI